MLDFNCPALSQSESSDLFTYIIVIGSRIIIIIIIIFLRDTAANNNVMPSGQDDVIFPTRITNHQFISLLQEARIAI